MTTLLFYFLSCF